MQQTRWDSWFTGFKCWLALTGMALLVRLRFYQETAVLLECLFYLALVLFLVRQPAFLSDLRALNPWHRYLLAGFVFALIGAQIVARARQTFPLVDWSMYTNSSARDRYYDYTAVRSDGEEVVFPIAEVFPSIGRAIIWDLETIAERLSNAKEEPVRQEARVGFEKWLRTWGEKYNQSHPDAPVRTIHVWECRIPVAEYRGRQSIERTPFWQIQLY